MAEQDKEPQFVPARYVGGHVIDLTQTGRKEWRNIDGSKRTDMTLSYGDTVMMPAEEVLGKTLYTPRGSSRQLLLGIGRVALPEHAEVPREELTALGYEFQDGRSDFEAIEQPPPASPSVQSEELPGSIEIDAAHVAEEAK